MDNPIRMFRDSTGRRIQIGGDLNNVLAEHNGIQIGRAEFDTTEEDCDMQLIYVEVDPLYQRAGIASQLMLLGKEFYNGFCINSHIFVDGAALLNYCNASVFQYDHPIIDDDRF